MKEEICKLIGLLNDNNIEIKEVVEATKHFDAHVTLSNNKSIVFTPGDTKPWTVMEKVNGVWEDVAQCETLESVGWYIH